MKAFVLAVMVGVLWFQPSALRAASTNIYSTQFEATDGFEPGYTLAGQGGWLGSDFLGNGIVNNYLPGQGQQAFIGANPPPANYKEFYLLRPVDFDPLAAGYPVVKFSVLLNFVDSMTTTNRDAFLWSVFNLQGDNLFSIEFNNRFKDIGYWLDGTNDISLPDLTFTSGINYTLEVIMNFASNRWSATYNNILIATNQPITTTNAQLTLGDIDAVWVIKQLNGTNAPGDNYMLFDNFRMTAENSSVPPAQMQWRGRTGDGWTLLRVFGDHGARWAVDATTNLTHWTALRTNQISGNYFDFVDDSAAGKPRRFYRARYVP